MIKLSTFPKKITGREIILEQPKKKHQKRWLKVRESNREALKPFEPSWKETELNKADFKKWLSYRKKRLKSEQAVYYLIIVDDEEIAGGINLGDISFGFSMSARLGYWLDQEKQGKGIMSKALKLVIKFAFQDLGLNRLEATVMPKNKNSQELLKRLNFSLEGRCRKLYNINSEWQDHLLFALLREDLKK